MLKFLKPWRFIAAILLGFSLGFASGVYVYANYLDQPEILNQTEINQKIKGRNNTGALDTQEQTEVNNSKPKKKKRRNKKCQAQE